MKISPFRKIIPENFETQQQSSASILASILNPIIDQLSNVLSGNINFADNIAANVVTLTVQTNRDMTPTYPLVIKTTIGTTIQGIIPIKVVDITQNPVNLTISNIATGTPGVVTTSVAHGFETGNRVSIGSTNSTPSINGNYVITAISPTQFQIPITVTGSGNAGNVNLSSYPYPQGPVVITFIESKQGLVTINTISGIPANCTYQITAIII